MLEVRDLGVWYPTSGTALHGLDLTVRTGEILVLAGRVGAGASTALRAVCARLPSGARRQGSIRLGEVEVTDAHPDDLAGAVTLIGDSDPAPALRIGDVLGGSSGHAGLGPVACPTAEVIESLGLDGHLRERVADASRSLLARATLAGALLSAPRVLLADQPLAGMESSWRDAASALLRRHADAGMSIVWVEHHLMHALPVADLALEVLGRDRVAGPEVAAQVQPAWSWRPRTLPFTPLQRVASVLDMVAPGADDPQLLGAALAGRLAGARRRVPDRPPTATAKIRLTTDESIDTFPGEPLQIVCATAESAEALHRVVAERHGIGRVTLRSSATLAELCAEQDRRLGNPRGASADRLTRIAGQLRLSDQLARHSRGEQSLVATLLELERGDTVAVLDPGRHLDAHTRNVLEAAVSEEAAGGRTVISISTDVEAIVGARRVLVFDGQRVMADATPMSVAERLPYLPRLAAACAPVRVADPDDVIQAVRDARAERGVL